jgi:DNA-directed RNA polymerase subunit RPC12/RpoP
MCGKPLEHAPAALPEPEPDEKHCPHCGAELEERAVFCTNCGHRLIEEGKELDMEETSAVSE